MLDGAFNVDERSRLCCQIIMSKELDGLEVELAPESLADAAGRARGGGRLSHADLPDLSQFRRQAPACRPAAASSPRSRRGCC